MPSSNPPTKTVLVWWLNSILGRDSSTLMRLPWMKCLVTFITFRTTPNSVKSTKPKVFFSPDCLSRILTALMTLPKPEK